MNLLQRILYLNSYLKVQEVNQLLLKMLTIVGKKHG
jgi:hypothetical protein